MARMFIADPQLCAPQGALCTVPGIGPLRLEHVSDDQGPQLAAQARCHRHEVFHLVVARRGRGRILLDGAPVIMRQHDLVLTDPDQPHSFNVRPGDSLRYAELTFRSTRPCPSWSALLTTWCGRPIEPPTCSRLPAAAALTLANRLRDCAECGRRGGPLLAQRLQGHLAQVLFALLETTLPGRDDDPMEAARLALERLDEAIDLSAAARLAGLSDKHFLRRFSRRYGCTPMRYRQEQAMQRALVLVRSTDYPLKAIAALCGFDDVRYFHRRFKRTHGVTPGSLRSDR